MTLTPIITKIATQYGLNPKLVAAIIHVESSDNPYAWRTEPVYRYLWDVKRNKPFRTLTASEKNNEIAPNDFPALVGSRNTEWLGQQASWGPMQTMGAVARELGFKGHFPGLCGEDGIEIGCQLLSKLFTKYYLRYGEEGVIAAYNAGAPVQTGGRFANQEYVDKVMGKFRG